MILEVEGNTYLRGVLSQHASSAISFSEDGRVDWPDLPMQRCQNLFSALPSLGSEILRLDIESKSSYSPHETHPFHGLSSLNQQQSLQIARIRVNPESMSRSRDVPRLSTFTSEVLRYQE